ncbi:agip28 [Agrotis ipsilon multiple nucleopolyhedrovirus]|uniref:Uncharacterized protein n=1 Tax=Agrotis ipsilon multiple nucleopolyhedrovirus TaxID=208013 RepID=B6D5U2_9ABAC|nr:agip28 [Agrotis ipsilon multiple nucleopolyhedrovirus]ACI28730.1 unknown [Agrotis ipsilon multiple nucleopolyhedrovirus]
MQGNSLNQQNKRPASEVESSSCLSYKKQKQLFISQFLRKKNVFSLQQLSMAALDDDVSLLYGIEVFTKRCWRCDHRFFAPPGSVDTNLCVKCRMCKFCGLPGVISARRMVVDNYDMSDVVADAYCTICMNRNLRRLPRCRQCNEQVKFLYPMKALRLPYGHGWSVRRCEECIFKLACGQCGIKYTELYNDHNKNQIHNLEFMLIVNRSYNPITKVYTAEVPTKPLKQFICETCYFKTKIYSIYSDEEEDDEE